MTTTPVPSLDVYEVAYLAGGPARVVDAALVALVRAGRLRVASPGQLATADLTRRHPVEAAVLDAVGPTGHRSADTVQWRLAGDERLAELGRRLRSAGLLGHRGLRLAPAPTRAGRRLLRELGGRPGPGDPEAVRVALGGRAAMSDPRLRAQVFDRPATTLPPGRPGHRSRGVDHSDPRLAAYRTSGGAAARGAIEAFHGGGF